MKYQSLILSQVIASMLAAGAGCATPVEPDDQAQTEDGLRRERGGLICKDLTTGENLSFSAHQPGRIAGQNFTLDVTADRGRVSALKLVDLRSGDVAEAVRTSISFTVSLSNDENPTPISKASESGYWGEATASVATPAGDESAWGSFLHRQGAGGIMTIGLKTDESPSATLRFSCDPGR
jgi:hypothetical protein